MTPAPLVLAALFAAPAPALPGDPDLIGMPGMPDVPAETAPAPAPADEAAPPPPPPTGPSETRFSATVSTRVDADLADDGGGEDTVESRLRLDLELATRLSPRTTALVAGRSAHESRTPDAAFDGARYAARPSCVKPASPGRATGSASTSAASSCAGVWPTLPAPTTS
jgi:hypothetical protein